MEYVLTLIAIAVGFLDWCLCACHKTDPAFYRKLKMLYKKPGVKP